jgi:MFS family permease
MMNDRVDADISNDSRALLPARLATNAWGVLALLFLANMFNFFDRTIPAIIAEPVRLEFGLNDFQLGLVAAAFTVVYAIAGVPLGRLADAGSRKLIMAVGLAIWSLATGLNGYAWSFASILVVRMAVGIGEASYGPAAMSMVGDLFPSARRSRAMGIYMLGLPAGLMLAFFSVGAIVKMSGTWRTPFFIAMVPGLFLALCFWLIHEPVRGGAEQGATGRRPIDRPMLRILRTRTVQWIIVSGIAANFSAYAANSFLVPLLQRYYGLPLQRAAIVTGVVVGVAGLIGLTLGGSLADRIHRRSERGRLLFGAASMAVAALATAVALSLGRGSIGVFTAVFAVGWLFQYQYYTCVYPAIQDVIEPRLRATAMAIYFACLYLLGGAFGPVVVGLLSDHYARAAMAASGATAISPVFKAAGLHGAMFLIPVALLLTAVALLLAASSFRADADAMKRGMAA